MTTERYASSLTWLSVAVAVGYLGCQNSGFDGDSRVTELARTLTESLDEGKPTETVLEQERLDQPVDVEWVDALGVKKKSGLSSLVLKVKNNKEFSVTTSAEILCEGLINRSGRKTLTPKSQKIGAGETVFFEIEANQMPIQYTEGASQFKAMVSVRWESLTEEKERVVRTAPVLYHHNSDFNSIEVFDMETLIAEQAGLIAGSFEKAAGTKVVARISDTEGRMQDIKKADVAAPVIDEQKRNHGTISGEFVEIEIDPPKAWKGEDK